MAPSLEQCEAEPRQLFFGKQLAASKKSRPLGSCEVRVGAKSLAEIKNEQLRDFALSFLAETPTLVLQVWLKLKMDDYVISH